MAEKEYLFGVNDAELQRLQVQHGVWKKITEDFFDRLNLHKGIKILDVGAGPGFVSIDLLERTGNKSEITVLEPSEYYLNHIKDYAGKNLINNFKYINNSLEKSELSENYYDFIFARWVITFALNPEAFLEKLIRALKPGGIIAVQDYAYEGISIYPRGGACDKIPDALRAYYYSSGGDPYVAAKIPKIFRENKVKLIDFKPNVQAGDSTSSVFEWANKFFVIQFQRMVDKGIISQELADSMQQDWIEHKNSEDSIFISPIVVV